jgi:hypothetical protein
MARLKKNLKSTLTPLNSDIYLASSGVRDVAKAGIDTLKVK